MSNVQRFAKEKAAFTAFNNHDPVTICSLLAENVVITLPTGQRLEGREAAEADYRSTFTAFPDARLELVNIVAPTAQTMCAEYRFHGTHMGPLQVGDQTIAPTGRSVKLPMLVESTYSDAQELIALQLTSDPLSQLMQLGVMQNPLTSSEQAIGVVDRLIDALNRGDAAACTECYSPGAVVETQSTQLIGRPAIAAAIERNLSALPGLQLTVLNQAAEGATVVTTLLMKGANTGPIAGRAGTGKEIRQEIRVVSQVGPAGIDSERRYQNQLDLFHQIGLVE